MHDNWIKSSRDLRFDYLKKYESRPHDDQWRKNEAEFEICLKLTISRQY